MAITLDQVAAALAREEGWLLQQPGVRAAFVGLDAEGNPGVVVLCDHAPEGVQESIRARLVVPVVFDQGFDVQPLRPPQ